MSDTVKCDKCHKPAEYVTTVHNNAKNLHYELYICEDDHENRVPIPKAQ